MAASDRSAIIAKHSLVIAGHRTSVSLEDAFWSALRRLAIHRKQSVAGLVAAIDADRGDTNLSSRIRVVLLEDAETRGGSRADETHTVRGTSAICG